ncbi:MAG: tRNA (guanosine(37)-N1)-methyltransferase TrmD [Clostridia bacterium]|nr:tRNA (guanosine(37)-N1)-methyltransferase TrmD [Clostridia bacterium]
MKFDILTLFPDMVNGILGESILGRAQKAGLIEINTHQIRDFSENKHRNVDDTPFGGGRGMLMAAPPIAGCLEHLFSTLPEGERRRVIYLSPKGSVLTQAKASSLLAFDRLILLCGHYEGVDERIIEEYVDEEISIGDYVLTGGELPACVLVDTVARMVDGVLAMPECFEEESIASGLLEYPQYTRPVSFHGREVPEVLLSGHHANIAAWRLEEALKVTKERRPELYEAYMAAHPPKVKKSRRKKPKTDEEQGK